MGGEKKLTPGILRHGLNDLPEKVFENTRVKLVHRRNARRIVVNAHKKIRDGNKLFHAFGFTTQRYYRFAALRKNLRREPPLRRLPWFLFQGRSPTEKTQEEKIEDHIDSSDYPLERSHSRFLQDRRGEQFIRKSLWDPPPSIAEFDLICR